MEDTPETASETSEAGLPTAEIMGEAVSTAALISTVMASALAVENVQSIVVSLPAFQAEAIGVLGVDRRAVASRLKPDPGVAARVVLLEIPPAMALADEGL